MIPRSAATRRAGSTIAATQTAKRSRKTTASSSTRYAISNLARNSFTITRWKTASRAPKNQRWNSRATAVAQTAAAQCFRSNARRRSGTERLACAEVTRDLRLPIDELRRHCGCERRANAGIRRLRRNRTQKLRLRPWFDCLLEIIRKSEKSWFFQESAVHPESRGLALRCETDRNRQVWIPCHCRQ